MTQDVRDWLPHGVVTHDAVRLAIEGALARWHDCWFVAPSISVSDMVAAPEAPWNEGDGDGWRIPCSAVAVRARRQTLSRLTDAVLDVESDGMTLTEADRYIVKGLERKIVESLAMEVEQAFGLTGEVAAVTEKPRDAFAENGGLLVSLKDLAGRELLTLGVPTEITLPVVKARLGQPAPARERFQPLATALGSASVAFEAVVGRVELSLTELNTLCVGDVLVLDSRVDEPVEIASARSHQIIARAQLSHVEDGIALVF